MSRSYFFISHMELFHPNIPKEIQNARKFYPKIVKLLEIYQNVYHPKFSVKQVSDI